MGNYSRFDMVLLGIAIMIIAMVTGMLLSLKLVAMAGLLALAILGYGLFVAPPVGTLDRKI